jgi:hypothetical protein
MYVFNAILWMIKHTLIHQGAISKFCLQVTSLNKDQTNLSFDAKKKIAAIWSAES